MNIILSLEQSLACSYTFGVEPPGHIGVMAEISSTISMKECLECRRNNCKNECHVHSNDFNSKILSEKKDLLSL